jgi:hypothetical protein
VKTFQVVAFEEDLDDANSMTFLQLLTFSSGGLLVGAASHQTSKPWF